MKKGMHSLKQAATLAYNNLKKHLKPFGYETISHTNGLWKHKTKDIICYLRVDDSGIRYTRRSDVGH